MKELPDVTDLQSLLMCVLHEATSFHYQLVASSQVVCDECWAHWVSCLHPVHLVMLPAPVYLSYSTWLYLLLQSFLLLLLLVISLLIVKTVLITLPSTATALAAPPPWSRVSVCCTKTGLGVEVKRVWFMWPQEHASDWWPPCPHGYSQWWVWAAA